MTTQQTNNKEEQQPDSVENTHNRESTVDYTGKDTSRRKVMEYKTKVTDFQQIIVKKFGRI